MNSFGKIFRLTTFGESHGKAIGGVIDGMPAGLTIDEDFIQQQLDRRRPGQSSIVTQRKENDTVNILSGLKDGMTLGTPIGFVVNNCDQRSNDYSEMEHVYRPCHADYTYDAKYGLRDYRGGGRASARETISRVVGGAFALTALRHYGMDVIAYTSQIGSVCMSEDFIAPELSAIESNAVRCPDADVAEAMINEIDACRMDCNSVGGVVTCVVTGCPVGLGEPVFDRLQSRLSAALMGINAAKGFEYGTGFKSARLHGSDVIDTFDVDDTGQVYTKTNYSGGIQGGISNGMPIYMRVAFKPTATMAREVETIDDSGNPTVLKARGRHDPCVVPRAVPVVQAMVAMTMLDALLLSRTNRI